MESFSKNEILDKLEVELRGKIDFAKENALSEEEYEEVSEKEFEMQSIQNKRELTDEEVEYYFDFRERMNKATIEVKTLIEAKRIMELLNFKQETLIDTLAHENAHGNVAEQHGAQHIGYKFVVIEGKGGYIIQPQANIYLPDEWDKNKQNFVLARITQAPEEYGNSISEGDKRDLKELGL
jgi:hypothetical protein